MGDIRWGIHAVRIDDPAHVVQTLDADAVMRTASTAKVLVLLEAARAIESGELSANESLDRASVGAVADSGLWQHLHVDELCVDDVACLIGVVSDNLATNVLLARLGGVDAVATGARRHAVTGVALHDAVRDVRTTSDPETLSTGSARGYATLMARIWTDDGIHPRIAARVREWLRDGVDTSMAAGAFALDPLAHGEPDRGFAVVNKTGTDAGIRADVGVVTGPGGRIAYACIANWMPHPGDPERDDVLSAMREFGERVRRAAS
jgi:beta-lactamase class A